MKISELTSGQGNVNVEGTIQEIGETRSFNKFGRELRVANAILTDDSGSIKLTLWNDDVTRFKEGDKVKILNGYVNEFQGENQLTSGKFGKIELASESETTESEPQKELEPLEDSEEPEEKPDEMPSEEPSAEAPVEEIEEPEKPEEVLY
jgi:replication factor A1